MEVMVMVMEYVMGRLMEVRVHSSGQRSLSSEERERATHTTQKIEANFECFLEAIQNKIPKVLELRPSARKGLGSPNIRMLKSDQMFQFHCSLKG